MKKTTLALPFSLLFLAGCAGSTPAPTPDPVLIKISDAASEIKRGVIQLEQIKQASNTVRIRHYKAPKFGPLTTKVSLKWSGDAVGAIKVIAKMIDYTVNIDGTRPIAPVSAVVDTINEPAFSVLEDIGWQVGSFVAVSVNEDNRSIHVVYKGEG